MNTYIVLAKFTDKGFSSIQDHPERVKRFKEIVQGEGAKVTGFYLLMGKYDIATIIEAPSPEVMAKISIIVGRRGNVTAMTLPAFTEKEQYDLIAKLG